MTLENQFKRRYKAVESTIQRLDRRIDRMNTISQQYSWYRLGIITTGLAAVFFTYNMLPINWVWAVIIFWSAIFFLAVYMHNRLDSWISKHKVYRDIKAIDQARMELAWSEIPQSTLQAASNPISVDLDLAGPRSIHHLIDLAVSNEGSQRLGNWLSQTVPEPQVILSRQKIVRELTPMTTFRNQLLLRFKTLSDQMLSGQKLIDWLRVDTADGRYLWNLLIGILFVTANISLFILSVLDILPNYWLVTTSFYLVFYIINQKQNKLLL